MNLIDQLVVQVLRDGPVIRILHLKLLYVNYLRVWSALNISNDSVDGVDLVCHETLHMDLKEALTEEISEYDTRWVGLRCIRERHLGKEAQ